MDSLRKIRAVIKEDLGVIKSSLTTGTDVHAIPGKTALIVALKLNHFKVAKILLDADFSGSVTDASTGKIALEILMTKKDCVIQDIAPHLMANFKRSQLYAEALVKLFIVIDSPLRYVMLMNDASINREFLRRNPSCDMRGAIELAMDRCDLECVKIILSIDSRNASSWFYNKLSSLIQEKKRKLSEFFIEHLHELDLVLENSSFFLTILIRMISEEYLQLFLNSRFLVENRKMSGKPYVWASIFSNRLVDVVRLLQNTDFNVNAIGYRGSTALHSAVLYGSEHKVRFLLESGADVNIKNKEGRTPLVAAMLINPNWAQSSLVNCVHMLLEYGAHVQLADNVGMTAFDYAHQGYHFSVHCLISQLAINSVQDLPIKQAIQYEINSDAKYTEIFTEYCQQLRALKTCLITEDISLFTILTDKNETFYRLDIQKISSLLDQFRNEHDLYSLYYSTIKTKLSKASNLYRFNCDMAHVIFENTGKSLSFDNLVINEISKYLTQHDVQKFITCHRKKDKIFI